MSDAAGDTAPTLPVELIAAPAEEPGPRAAYGELGGARIRLCVFCGSSTGRGAIDVEAAQGVGKAIAARGAGLVYGGASVGLMGVVADAALGAGVEVVGVLPEALAVAEVAHPALGRLELVTTMHERKARMAELSDGYVVLPGGLGTLEEMFEVWTWAHLGIHRSPLGLLNIGGYFDPLLRFVDDAVEAGFVPARSRDLVVVGDDPQRLVDDVIGRIVRDAPAPDPRAHVGEILAERRLRQADAGGTAER
ncbi:TIGR00730 family Rossman fold protein [Yinghuangia sp. ASG 101]|uniref:LOG family protein n=1 Tax=Yinghuangia sp. ASG 101 TaxID=2896848 RepID=UPI001E632F4A|nr:TIGR00730 family Rossman fold protein [Yinghuangia sp. ASG 101]UGQ12676.1 TIGR00730 family Rossman fold protein [Yinghuangia sp. ASG 101]